MIRGQLTCSRLQEGKQADTADPLEALPTPTRTLHIRDRGFTEVPRWKAEREQEQFVLSYLRSDVSLFDLDGNPLDLAVLLPQAEASGEWEVLVGGEQRLPMRLFFEKVPDAIAEERRRRGKRRSVGGPTRHALKC